MLSAPLRHRRSTDGRLSLIAKLLAKISNDLAIRNFAELRAIDLVSDAGGAG
jgi:hypothetical protein